jgi:hypothetical protein
MPRLTAGDCREALISIELAGDANRKRSLTHLPIDYTREEATSNSMINLFSREESEYE